MTHKRWRQTRGGYLFMGKIRIPPFPQYIVMTDRADGKLWVLQHTLTPPHADGYGYVTISDTMPNDPNRRTYGPFEGPYLGTEPRATLFVRGGYLGYEVEELPVWLRDRDNAPILTRRGLNKETRRIIIPVGWSEFSTNSYADIDELAWSPEAL